MRNQTPLLNPPQLKFRVLLEYQLESLDDNVVQAAANEACILMKALGNRLGHPNRDGFFGDRCRWSGYDCHRILRTIGFKLAATSNCNSPTRQASKLRSTESCSAAGSDPRPPGGLLAR